jgi:hypothetical protein
MSRQSKWEYLVVTKEFGAKLGVTKLAPRDLCQSCARLCHTIGSELEQVQFLLGHISVNDRWLQAAAARSCQRPNRHCLPYHHWGCGQVVQRPGFASAHSTNAAAREAIPSIVQQAVCFRHQLLFRLV